MEMINTEMTLKTPRGTFSIHTIFSNAEEAKQAGWYLWFDHKEWGIYTKDNHAGAVVRLSYLVPE